MNKFDASYIKYDLQGQLKNKLHDLQVAKKLQQSETSEEFLLGYSKAVSDLGLAVVNWNYPKEHTDAHAQTYPLRKLNEDFGLRVEKNGKLKNFFTLKIGRKTFGSQVAQEKGVEVASRALNHSDTQVTRDHYIVPEEKDLEFEFEDKKSNVENIDKHRLEKVKKLK